jgi:5-methylcytosine-specific restriction endonuclease McrA
MQRGIQTSVFAEGLDSVIEARLRDDIAGARNMLQSICAIGTPRLSESVPRRREAGVLTRDKYTCRYCGYRLLSIPVMRAVHELFPDIFRWHRNWKTSESDIAWWRDATSVDHVVPATRGGTNDPDNLVGIVLAV